MRISNNTLPIEIIEKILQYGKELLENRLLDGVEETLEALHGKYKYSCHQR
jgi:putative hydrolase of the HAD superfamily